MQVRNETLCVYIQHCSMACDTACDYLIAPTCTRTVVATVSTHW